MESIQAVRVMSALAQESRLEVFRLLVACGDEGMPAGRIAEHLEIPAATLSFHLKELNHAGSDPQHRQGRSLIYRLNVEAMRALFAYLMEDCCQGRRSCANQITKRMSAASAPCTPRPKSRRRKARREYQVLYQQIEDGWIMARVPDLPGAVTQGKDIEEARSQHQGSH